MEAYLQAMDLDGWRVTDEGMKNGTKKEKQFDVIAMSIILSSLDLGVFDRVFNCENAHELWKTIMEQNEGSKEVANERYRCLLKEFNSFKQLANENAKSMYSHLNVLVKEINALGVKNITDLNINRKILQSLWKSDYDLVKAIIYEKKLKDLNPSHMLSKIMVHELQIMPKSKKAPQEKPQEPSSSTTCHALSSQQEKVMSRMATHGSSSEDDVMMKTPQVMKTMYDGHVREEDLQVCEESQHVRLQLPLERRVSSSTHQVHKDRAQAQEEGGGQGEETKTRSNYRHP
jgi:hypothetical protein